MSGKETRGYGCAVAQFLFLLVALTVVGKADAISIIDQQNNGPSNGSEGGVIFGQSFTPTLPRIDFFEVEIGDFGSIDEVQILNGVSGLDGLSGAVLGTSDPAATAAPSGRQPVRFIFPGGIALTPGDTYVARIFSIDGSSAPAIAGISITTYNAYTGGRLLAAGSSELLPYFGDYGRDYDAVFQEGLTGVPEVATIWVVAIGLALIVVTRRGWRYGADAKPQTFESRHRPLFACATGKPVSVSRFVAGGNHSSRPAITDWLERPTRKW